MKDSENIINEITEDDIKEIQTRCANEGLNCGISFAEIITGQVGQANNKIKYYDFNSLKNWLSKKPEDPTNRDRCSPNNISDCTKEYRSKVITIVDNYFEGKGKNTTERISLIESFKKLNDWVLKEEDLIEEQEKKYKALSNMRLQEYFEENYPTLHLCVKNNLDCIIKQIKSDNRLRNENTSLEMTNAGLLFNDTAELFFRCDRFLKAMRDSDDINVQKIEYEKYKKTAYDYDKKYIGSYPIKNALNDTLRIFSFIAAVVLIVPILALLGANPFTAVILTLSITISLIIISSIQNASKTAKEVNASQLLYKLNNEVDLAAKPILKPTKIYNSMINSIAPLANKLIPAIAP